MKVLFVGDINPDLILGGLESLPVIDKEISCASYEKTMGSTAVISAAAYGGLGGDAAFFGLAGEDEDGDFMLRGMEEFGIDVRLVQRSREVRTGLTVNLIYRNTRTQITYPGAMAVFDGSGLDEEVLRRFGHVHFAGPYQQTQFRPRLIEYLRLARKLGVTTSLDPQWDASEQWQHMADWLPLLNYLFVNRDEALSISKTGSLEKAAESLCRTTPTVVIKNGAQGALICTGDDRHPVSGLKVRVVDPTGAGDVFSATFLYCVLVKGMNPAQAGRFANAAAARSCGFAGGVSHRSAYQDVIQFLEEAEASSG